MRLIWCWQARHFWHQKIIIMIIIIKGTPLKHNKTTNYDIQMSCNLMHHLLICSSSNQSFPKKMEPFVNSIACPADGLHFCCSFCLEYWSTLIMLAVAPRPSHTRCVLEPVFLEAAAWRWIMTLNMCLCLFQSANRVLLLGALLLQHLNECETASHHDNA